MDQRGNMLFNMFFFIIAVGVLVVFINPISEFVDIAQQSDNLNCKGFVFNGDNSSIYSFNATKDGGQSGSPIGCIAIRLYLPYIILVLLLVGVQNVLYNTATNQFQGNPGG